MSARGTCVRSRDLDRARDLAEAIHRAHGRARDFDRTRAHVGGLERAHGLASDLASDLERLNAHSLGRDLASARAHIVDLDRDLNRLYSLATSLLLDVGHHRGRDRDLARLYHGDLARARARNRELIVAIARVIEGSGVAGVTPMSRQLAAAAARLLPAQERARFAEEFASELWEIAHADGRRAQLEYTTRQVISAWRLRAALRVPQRHSATP